MSFLDKKLYPLLPLAFQNLAISAYGYYWKRRRFGGIYQEEYKGFKEREQYTQTDWHDYQTMALRKLLLHAFETVPYYRKTFSAAGMNSGTFQRFELHHLNKLPILTKEDLRKYGTNELLSSKREAGGQFYSSSGSTGTPVQIMYSHAFHQRINAAMEARVRNWAGVSSADPRGMIGGRRVLPDASNIPPYYRYNFFEKQTYFSAYHISKASASNYLKGILQNKIKYMTGYAMSNYLLASFFDELNLDVPPLKAVITSSEKLTSEMRALLSKVYDCEVFDSYSGVENCALISQNKGNLFINPDVGIVEIHSPEGNNLEGEMICTGLLNWDQPLIRYQIGDYLRYMPSSIQNAPNMPCVEEITGRTEDIITTKDGRAMVRFHGIYADIASIKLGQVIQHDTHHYTVKVQSETPLREEEIGLLMQRMLSQVGASCSIHIEQVSHIPLTANGKFKAVISEFN